MARKLKVRDLAVALERALERQKLDEALEHLAALEKAEPAEARWSHRTGDVLRRQGKRNEALTAYERAVDRYAAQGFIARAVAMAKTVLSIDAERVYVLERVDPEAARALRRPPRAATPPVATSTPAPATISHPAPPASIPAAPLNAPAKPLRAPTPPVAQAHVTPTNDGWDMEDRPSVLLRAAKPLQLAHDAASDEVRFSDLEDEDAILIEVSEEEVVQREAPKLDFDLVEELEEEASAEHLAVLPAFPLFTQVAEETLQSIARDSSLVELEGGAWVIRKGDPADSLYAIVEGAVRVHVPGLGEEGAIILGEGDVFGESCLLTDEPRHADVSVEGRLSALCIPKSVLDAAVTREPQVGDVLFELLTRRLIGNLLATSELFVAFDGATRVELAHLFELRRAAEGTLLLERGKRSDGLYILLTGRLETDDGAGNVIPLGAGTVIGQGSLLSRSPADLSVRAAAESTVLRLPAAGFSALATQFPPALEHLAELAARGSPNVARG